MTEQCAKCQKPLENCGYYGCWCNRWWCSEECAKQDGRVFIGDSYDTDHISCNYCRNGKTLNQVLWDQYHKG